MLGRRARTLGPLLQLTADAECCAPLFVPLPLPSPPLTCLPPPSLLPQMYPCPKDGTRFRPQVVAEGGKAQFPYLKDPNTGVCSL